MVMSIVTPLTDNTFTNNTMNFWLLIYRTVLFLHACNTWILIVYSNTPLCRAVLYIKGGMAVVFLLFYSKGPFFKHSTFFVYKDKSCI